MHEVHLESPIYIYVAQRKHFHLPLRTTSIFSVHTALSPITH